ncbi:MAG TPA: PilC/PilY family type IV pilus protein, partial [Burkholderiales bacterium]|nr:PilC/PilY family type IV pilus protein [Burkholderiales bacterium]
MTFDAPRPNLAFRASRMSLALAGAFGVLSSAGAASTDIANEPLTQAASGVRPNIMFILDDSGSMGWDYSPDYIEDVQPSGGTPSTTAACYDAGDPQQTNTNFSQDFDDSTGTITGRPDHCIPGDPPYMSPDFNKQYYNPAIRYRPGVKADGTDMPNMDKATTSTWTAVPTDPYGKQQRDTLNVSTTKSDLVNKYPDRAWCKNSSDSPTDTTNCKVNSSYTYPDRNFNKGIGTASTFYGVGNNSDDVYKNTKYRNGAPYYYRMQTAQWCSTSNLAAGTCVSGQTVVPNTHKFIAPEFCTDPELVNCAAGQQVTAQHIYSGPRWCKDKTTLVDCQRKKINGYIWPKHLGVTELRNVTLPATSASATLQVDESSAGEKLTTLKVGSTSIISTSVTAADSSTSALAIKIRDAINAYTSSPNYTATASGNVVTITSAVAGTSENGKVLVTASTQSGNVAAQATIVVDNESGNAAVVVNAVTVNHPTSGLINLMSPTCTGSYGFSVTAAAGVLTAATGTNNPNERASLASGIADCINKATASTSFSATTSADTIIITAPVLLGLQMNSRLPTVVKGGTLGQYIVSAFAGGQSAGVVVSTSGSMSGGIDATSGTNIPVHVGYGHFSRVDIVAANDSYPKSPARSDCAGANCTYAEEMTNFSNWYAYYRTRLQMMKTAAGRAFVPIDDTYRVGFITINPGSPVSSSKYLRIQDYDPTHKGNWYTKFYDQASGGGTPLREALSRVGRLYAGQFDKINNGIPTADDPVIVSCQPNFAILSTDGYWTDVNSAWDGNTNIGRKMDNSSMTQQDNKNVGPYSLQTQGVWDGGDDGTVGLADVALYYYQNDLRAPGEKNASSGVDVSADNVPTTDKDFAAHQHMTTFTLGLGLDGTLTYRSDYETAKAGDFYGITQGTLSGSWPNPVQDSPTALDDLWHAAANGRGVFFSASNPAELANSLTDTLNALKQRVGAGAAAATSNLQPVAGDNFAFTAQYQTVQWIGDVKARTIDLGSGSISNVELWSAQKQLNARLHTSRTLYTFDATDAYVSTSTGAAGNQLKHFCDPAAVGASWCNDGTGLTVLEMSGFKPTKLPQYPGYNASQLVNATASNLVNYLRGHQAFEDQGAASSTDLFRERSALLGDIINAQPSYVKQAPFEYSDKDYDKFKACTQNVATAGCPAAQFPPDAALSAPYPRRPTVYVSSNDGMLHAIETDVNNNPYYQTAGIPTPATGDDTFSTGNNAGNGEERWAYIPGMILPDLYKLASEPYVHRYFVDGSPVVGDICISTPCAGLNDWRTILVGGLNSGGRGFYALDVTNPRQPRALWEFKVRKPSVTACAATTAAAIGATDDCDLGLSYGNPVISKVSLWNGSAYEKRWVVMVTSGHNNVGVEPFTTLRQGDGDGYLYILDAITGKILQKIGIGVGNPGTSAAGYADADPAGLAKVNNWVNDSLHDNTTLAVYAGDLKGNLWRFDLDPASPTYLKPVLVALLQDAGGTPQPVTTKPELGQISGRRVVFVATGKFLGESDKADTNVQTVYAISDDISGNVPVKDRTPLIEQVIVPDTSTTRTVSSAAKVDWSDPAMRGWYVDLPDKGERVSVDLQLQLGTLVVPSNVPSDDTCVAGGTGWINTFDYKTGSFVAGATASAVSQKVTGSVVVGINVIQLPGGKVVTVVTTADNQQRAVETPIAPTSFQGKRVGWR